MRFMCFPDWIPKVQRNLGSSLPKDACKSERSYQELSNEYLVAKIGLDTAENESSKVCQKIVRQLDRLS